MISRLLLTACLLSCGVSTLLAERPNVVLVLCDDIRWNAMSCAGHPHLKTPNIDRLAAQGLHCENMFCTTSLCSPSRATILSGLYANAHGVTNNFTDYPADLASFPRTLQAEGYRTAYIGKWHMGEDNDQPRPGFDHFVTHRGQGQYFDTEFNTNGRGREVIEGYYTTVVTDMATRWLGEHLGGDQPVMLMLGHKAPHSFYFPEPKYEHAFDEVAVNYPHSAFRLGGKPTWIGQRLPTWHGIYGPLFDWRKDFPDDSAAGVLDFEAMVRAYWGTILSVDDSVGRLTDLLRQAGQLDNTMFIFMGDNGLLEGEHGMVDKRTAHEPSMRVPMIIRYPAFTPDGPKRLRALVSTADVAPTILDACGAPPLANIHGRSIRPVAIDENADWRDGLLYGYNYEKQFPYTPNVRAIRTDQYKYIRYPHGDGGPDRHIAELYDLNVDPQELHNLLGPEQAPPAGLAERLDGMLQTAMADVGLAADEMPIDEGIGTELPDAAIR